jgi:hypothetical protein
VGRLAYIERDVRERLVDQAPVILVRVGDEDAPQGRVFLDEPRNIR